MLEGTHQVSSLFLGNINMTIIEAGTFVVPNSRKGQDFLEHRVVDIYNNDGDVFSGGESPGPLFPVVFFWRSS